MRGSLSTSAAAFLALFSSLIVYIVPETAAQNACPRSNHEAIHRCAYDLLATVWLRKYHADRRHPWVAELGHTYGPLQRRHAAALQSSSRLNLIGGARRIINCFAVSVRWL
jgi:hypothetical protein